MVPELFPTPPTLCISGPELQAVLLLRVLHTLSRRALLVARLQETLPFYLQPTLLIYDPTLTPNRQAAWAAANRAGFVIANARRGEPLVSYACAKAVHVPAADSQDGWGAEALRIPLLPGPVQEWQPFEEQQLASTVLPKLFEYRLRTLLATRLSDPATNDTARKSAPILDLLRGLEESPEIRKALKPYVAAQQEIEAEVRESDPKRILVECLWGPSHRQSEIRSAEIVKRANALLRNRGSVLALSDRQAGWRLRELGIAKRRDGKGMFVQFSPAVRQRIHLLARQFGLELRPTKGCRYCKPAGPSKRK